MGPMFCRYDLVEISVSFSYLETEFAAYRSYLIIALRVLLNLLSDLLLRASSLDRAMIQLFKSASQGSCGTLKLLAE